MTIKFEYIYCGDIMTKIVTGTCQKDCAMSFKASTIYDALISARVCK